MFALVARVVRCKPVLCGVFILFVHVPAATAARYRFDSWTADNGLPQNIVIAIHQTRDGYLWIATLDGLARFDGVRFTVFDKNNTPGITTNRFTALFEDAADDLWIGAEGGTITRYRRGRFTSWTAEQGAPTELILGFTQDDESRLLVVSSYGITRFDPAGERFVSLPASRFASVCRRLLWSERPGFWTVDAAGLHVFAQGRWTTQPLPADLRGESVIAAAQAQDGSFWIETETGRRARLANGASTLHTDQNQTSRVDYRDRHGEQWSLELRPRLARSLTLVTPAGSASRDFTTLFEDRDGRLWLGTDGRGLQTVRTQPIVSYSQPQGLAGRNVYPILEDRAGDVWIGTWDGGITRVHEGRFINYTAKDGLYLGTISALGEDHAGRLWISVAGHLQVWQHGRFTNVPSDFAPRDAAVNVIYQDRAGVFWFGTDRGLVRKDGDRTQLFTVKDGLAGDTVRVIIERPDGDLWIGSYGGLTRLSHGRFSSWRPRDGLPGDLVRTLYEDTDGVLWIGTYDSGLGRFQDGRFTRYTTRDGLFNDGVFQILEDAHGNLWMTSNRGISRVAKRDLNEFAAGRLTHLNVIAYGKDDGMLNVECNGGLWPAGIVAHDGKLWLPTQDGVAVVDPEAITIDQQAPPVVIESVLVDRTPVALDRVEAVRIEPGARGLEIAYTGLSFLNAERMRFRFRLEGLDRDWVDAGTRRTAYYSHLPAGDYTFRVTAANSDGVWNRDGQLLRISVLPMFYQKTWFLLLMLTSVMGTAALWHQRRLARVRAAHAAQADFSRRLLASQEEERQRIAAELHDSLGQQLLVIRNRAMLGERLAEDPSRSRAEFDEISTSASSAIDEVRAIAHNLRPTTLDRLGLSASIEELVETLANTTGLQFTADVEPLDGVLSNEEEITCYRIIQESVHNIVKHAAATKAYVDMWHEGGALQIIVRDNGRGVGDAAVRPRTGLGLTSIAERVRMLGGQLSIESSPRQGTTIHIHIPLVRRPIPA